MTRSRKKTPITGFNHKSPSDKAHKVAAHRRERKKVRTLLHVNPEVEVLPHRREVSNLITYQKEGKYYQRSPRPKDLRK